MWRISAWMDAARRVHEHGADPARFRDHNPEDTTRVLEESRNPDSGWKIGEAADQTTPPARDLGSS